ncbi:MAG: 50S ribosomal protein L15 [Candidatus Parcubacteria bacterium]|nr:50S ribosomal protein L15 [Candidatus Parcubacteria bacterium]
MALNLYNLKPATGAKKRKIRVGRGLSSGHGTYSGRGAKGQRARSGGKGGLKAFGLKGIIQSTPKLGGFRSLKPKLEIVNLSDLEQNFKDGDIITPQALKDKGLIGDIRLGVKILGDGKLTKKLVVKVNKISESGKVMIEKNGGQVILLGAEKSKPQKDNK